MSAKISRLKAAIKAHLVDSGVWEEAAVIIDRQGDITRSAAVAMGAASHGSIVILGVAEGDATEAEGLETELLIPVTILAKAIIQEGQTPEEELWEATVEELHNFKPVYEGDTGHWTRRLRYGGFSDAPELARPFQEFAQLARQTIFKVRFSLNPKQ